MPYIFLVHLSEFRQLDKNIWKIGHSPKELTQIISEYPTDTRFLMACSIEDDEKTFALLKQLLDNHSDIKRRSDFGPPFYESDIGIIAHVFSAVSTSSVRSPQ
jgi:hypothetical protein